MVHLLAALAGAVLALPAPCLDGEPVVEPATEVAFERPVGLAPRLELTGVAVRKRFCIQNDSTQIVLACIAANLKHWLGLSAHAPAMMG